MSMFDPQALENAEISEPMSTKVPLVPDGQYQAVVEKTEIRGITTKAGDERVILTVTWEVLSEDVRVALERDKVTVRQDVWLDLDEDGQLSTQEAKNVDLGRLRAALDQNADGAPWSIKRLIGGTTTINVSKDGDYNRVRIPVLKETAA